VRGLAGALVAKVQSCKEPLSAQAVGSALYGLQGMSSEHPEVRRLVGALAAKVRSCTDSLSAQNVGNALKGLQGMSSEHPEVPTTVHTVLQLLWVSASRLQVSAIPTFDAVTLKQTLAMVLPELHDVSVSLGQLEQWRALDTSLAAELSSHRQRGDAFFAPPAQWPPQAEKDVYKRVEALAQDLGAMDVRRNDHLLDCFESDVAFKVPSISSSGGGGSSRSGHTGGSSSMVTINIEVDGQHHKQS
jgi:hypothetical protein